MKLNAKVSIKSVNTFKQKAINIQELSNLFDSGKSCVSEIKEAIEDKISALDKVSPDLDEASELITDKIDALDKEFDEWTRKYEDVHDELEDKENELDSVDKTIIYTDSDGNEHETTNPEYISIKNEMSSLRSELHSIENEIDSIQKKIDGAEQIKNKIETYIDKIEGAISRLEELKKDCETFENDIVEAKQENNRICDEAIDLLKKIENIIERYLQVKNSTSQIEEALKKQSFPVSYIEEFHLDFSPVFVINLNDNSLQDDEEDEYEDDDLEILDESEEKYDLLEENDEDDDAEDEEEEEDDELEDDVEEIEEASYEDEVNDDEIDDIPTEEENTHYVKLYYDDNGIVYREGQKLKPNVSYVVNGYSYKTDDKGRIASASGKLRMRDPGYKRRMERVRKYDGQEYRPNDEEGHLIAHQFGGSDKLCNLVPMSYDLNHGDFDKVEKILADALKYTDDVRLEVEPLYDDDSSRPTEIKVSYSIDGEKEIYIFKNQNKEENE